TSSAEAVNRPQQSMKLAWDRSMAVAQALVAKGVDWWQLRLVICADHDRVSQFPSTRADDRNNSRVEVVITDEVVPNKVPLENGSTPITSPADAASGSSGASITPHSDNH
ncbi:MAG TPA: hypothetical protein VG711_08735, partial [Phycisphaerales bacterium]|nr:hypothetical protein [Phycisphaerales bacterium]